MKPAKTIHRQFGSKVRSATALLQLVPHGMKIWCEVFAGTAALTLAKAPHPAEHINDLNSSAINLFQVIRDDAQRKRLCEMVNMTLWAQGELIDCQDRVVDPDPVEWARRYLVSSWQAIGGKQCKGTGWRIQRDEDWCMGTWSRLPTRIREAAVRLKDVYIHQRDCRDFVRIFEDRDDAFLFVDPPYPLELTGTHGQQVYEVDMSLEDHREFAELLAVVKCKVLLTMAYGSLYEDIMQGWHRRDLKVRGLRNTVKSELILTNFEPPSGCLFAGAA